jgi:small subunit ribosomal protein S4
VTSVCRRRPISPNSKSLGAVDRRGVPQWLELEKEKLSGRVKGMPSRSDFTMPIREQLIVELYSK